MNRSLLKMYQGVHTGSFCIFSCCLYNLRINVVALNVHVHTEVYQIFCFLKALLPELCRNQVLPLLPLEGSLHARCNVGANHSRFNGKCTAAAEGIHKNPILSPRSELDQAGSQGLLNGCLADHLAVASFVETLSGGIQSNGDHVFVYRDTDRVILSIFLKPIHMVMLFHSLHHGLLGYGLNIRSTEQLTFHGSCLGHPEPGILWKIVFPRYIFYILKKLLKGGCLKFANLPDNSLGCPQKNIGSYQSFHISGKSHFAIFHLNDLVSQIGDFSFTY